MRKDIDKRLEIESGGLPANTTTLKFNRRSPYIRQSIHGKKHSSHENKAQTSMVTFLHLKTPVVHSAVWSLSGKHPVTTPLAKHPAIQP